MTTTESHTPDVLEPGQTTQQILGAGTEGRSTTPETTPNDHGAIPAFSEPETPASQYTSSNEQFADLHNRLQSMMKHIAATSRDSTFFQTQATSKHEDLSARLSRMEASLATLHNLNEKLDSIQADVRQTKSDLHNALDLHVANLKRDVLNTHHVLNGTLAGMGSGFGRFVWVVVGGQVVLVVAYLVYKRRKANSPKKYL